MPSKPPGVLSFVTQREAGVYGVGRPPGPAGNAGPLTRAELDRRGALLAREVGDAFGWTHTRRAAWYLLGSHSFSAGVSYGLFENLALSVAGAADMLKTFALAEWWASRYGGTGAARIRAQISMATIPVVGPTLVAASMLSRPFALEHKAREAYEEREAIMEAVGHVFTHPKDFLGKLVDSQVARFREFKACMAEESLAGSFQAGKLLGELLFDVLMAIDLVGGLAKLALAVPRVARFTEKLAKLAGELRTAKRLEKAAAKDAELLDPPPKTPGRQNGPSGGSGRPAGGERPPAPPPPAPAPAAAGGEGWDRDPTRGEKGVYGEAQSDVYMEEEGFQKLNGDMVKLGDDPLGPGIDGVWKNSAPPPEYVITESKYGSSGLDRLDDGTKQMSDDWVDGRLDKAVGPTTARDIRDADENGLVEKWLLNVDENGNVTKSLLDKNGDVIPMVTGGS